MNENREGFNKDDAYKILDTVNMWIANCDTKASVFIASVGVICSIAVSSDLLGIVINVIGASLCFDKLMMIPFNLLLWLSLFSILLGLFFLVKVILPQILNFYFKANGEKKRFDSFMFYGTVAKKNYEDYCSQIEKIKNDDLIIKDLLFQINSASKICDSKFRNFKKGVFFFSTGISIFMIQVILFYALQLSK